MANQKIDINTASISELESLVGVGHAKAEAIAEARKACGGFSSIAELMKVPGIGPGLLEQNRSVLSCSSNSLRTLPSSPPSGSKQVTAAVPRKCERETRSSSLHLRRDSSSTCTDDSTSPGPAPSEPCTSQHSGAANKTDKIKTAVADPHSDTANHRLPSHPVTRRSKCLAWREKQNLEADSSDEDGSSDATHSRDSDSTSSSSQRASQSPSVLISDTDGQNDASETQSAGVCDNETTEECNEGDDSLYEVCKRHSSDTCEGSPPDRGVDGVPTRTRIMSASEKHWMKRKCENEETKGHSPGKKPCRHGDAVTCDSDDEGVSLAHALRNTSASAMAANMRKQKIPSRSNPPPELASWLKTFQEWSHAERLMALDELMDKCEPTQVRHVMGVIEPQFQRDFISLLPKELALYVLSFLEPQDLLRAAQTCRYWCVLAEDNLLWREKCREESIDEMLVFGTKSANSSLLKATSSAGRGKVTRYTSTSSPKTVPPWKTLYMRQKRIEQNWRANPLRSPKLLKGHDDHVITCLEFCGNRIVSGSDDNTLKVWSAITGKCLRTLVGHTGGVWSSQMSDSVVISGSTDRTLKVWNVDTGQCTYTLYGHTSTVRCMHLHGDIVVSGSRDATLRMWDITSGNCIHVLMGHVAAVRCVQYDGRRVVSGAYDYMVKVWDPQTETCLHTLQGHSNRVYSLQFDGVHIVSGSLDTSIRVWDVETGSCLHTLIGHQSLTSGMELKDNTLVSGNADSTVKVWDITTGQCLQTLQGPNKHQSAVTCLQFNKRFVITSSDDGTVKIWDVKTGDFLRNLVALESGGSGGVVWRIRCSNTRLVCAVGSRNGTEETKLMVLNFDIEEDSNNSTRLSPSGDNQLLPVGS